MSENDQWRPPTESERPAAAPYPADPQFAAGAAARVQRRKVLLALGGITLLAGGGVAAGVAAASKHGGTGTAADGTSPGASGRTTPSTSASHTPTASASPTPSHTLGPVATQPQYYVDDEGSRAIALTMDDGPHRIYTPQVLDVLRQYGVKATFNMIGQQVGGNLSLVREVSAAGHTITNHTWNHADMTKYSDAQTLSEIDRCNDALAAADQHPTIFRAPFGYWTPAVFRACAARNLKPVGWSVDPDDWDTAKVDTQDIVHTVLTHTRAHSIILEHDGGGVRRNTVAALKIFIPELLERGYEFVAM